MNTSNPHHPVGIGMGGREGTFRIWLDGTDMSNLTCTASDATFESGNILQSEDEFQTHAKIRSIEVYGFGGADAFAEQRRRKEAEEELKQDRKKIDKSKLIENQFDREILFSKIFKAGQGGQDRLGTA